MSDEQRMSQERRTSEEVRCQGQEGRDAAERAMRCLLREHELPEPDEILDHEDGGIVCLWHEPKVAIVVDLEPRVA
jgi:hypothetical protein